MLRRLANSQEHFPLVLEMESIEREALREVQQRPVLPVAPETESK
jgi:hypothetical protein